MKDLENILILLLIFVVNIEDVVEPDPSMMHVTCGYLDTCSFVTISTSEARNVLRAQMFWGGSYSIFTEV